MRITVNLGIFFHDHRSLAKIFINKRMKCIKDVEDHITKIFKIQNFYLKCDNQYLPPTEDVQILNYDDVVWAVPVKKCAASINVNGLLSNEENEYEGVSTIEKKKKKKEVDNNEIIVCEKRLKKQKKHHSESITNHVEQICVENEDLMEVENTPKPKKKKKNKKFHVKNALFTSNEITNKNSEDESNNVMCDKIQINSPDATVKESSPKDSGRDSLEGSKIEDAASEDPNINVKSLVHTFENKRVSFSRHFRQAVSDGNERRVNIVKTIIISNKSNPADDPKPESSKAEDAGVSTEQKEQDSNLSSNTKNEDNVKTHLDEDSIILETSNSISCSTSNELDANVNKRKRKRTRSRKRKHRSDSRKEPSGSFEQPIYNFIHKPLIVQTPTHIRFRHEQSTPRCNEASVTSEVVVNSEQKDSLKNEVIVITESPAPIVEPAKTDDSVKETTVETEAANGDTTYSHKEIEQCILRQPITPNAEPRIGDVIAFKILRISDSYTPEVSSTVVGKVINYNPEDKEIIFNIVYGRDQCLMPQGKFSVDHEDHPTEEHSQFQCCWSSLLEPRLLFP